MNHQFDEYVKKKTAYDSNELDDAVYRAIARARNDKMDVVKIFKMAVAAAAVLLMAISLENNSSLREKTRVYFIQNSAVTEENAKAAHSYLNTGVAIIWERLQ